MSSRDEREALARFSERYAAPSADVAAEIERRVIGAVSGANGYTTVDQADELGRLLNLGPGRRLLDVGTGRGWPGLHRAQTTGCAVVGTDMPLEALAVAARRGRRESRRVRRGRGRPRGACSRGLVSPAFCCAIETAGGDFATAGRCACGHAGFE